MELGIAGFVTAEEVVRIWTRDGCRDWWLQKPKELRKLLGAGRVDREPMIASGAVTEMIILDESNQSLIASAPFQPEDGRWFPLAAPFSVAPVTGELSWSEEIYEVFTEWLTSRIDASGYRGETLHVFERDRWGRGTRAVSVGFLHDGEEWFAAASANAWPEDNTIWAQARQKDGLADFRFPGDADSAHALACLVAMTVLSWPGGPLDLVIAWTPAPSGRRPRV